MKRYISLLLLFVASIATFAQTQQGIVKTRGRMVNGQVVAGKRLAGATVTLNFGNPLVSGNQGSFSFNVPSGRNYSLVAATKQGYTLADPEYTMRSFSYSASNPFYVVLEDEAQRQADINAATRKVRRTLTAQLQAREDEIEALKAQNKITEKEYQKRLQQLYDNQSNSEKLVKEMAERYASTDYDQLDEFNRQVQMYIEEGELQKADSMIRSKGDIEKRVEEYHRVLAANKKERVVLEQREMLLEKSEQAVVKTFDDLCQDLYRRRDIFMQKHMPDSVLFCLKLLADLDTTNVSATYNYAYFAYERFQCDEALRYTLMTIRNAEAQDNSRIMALAENHIGNIYMQMNRLDESKEMYLRCLEHCEALLFRSNGVYFRHLRTMPIINLGIIYQKQGNIEKAEEYFLKSLSDHKELIHENYKSYIWNYVWTEDRVGQFYIDIRNYEEANIHLDIALSIISDSIKFPHNINGNIKLYASVRDHLGWLKYQEGDYAMSIMHYTSAAQHFEKLYKNDPDIYRLNLTRIYYYWAYSASHFARKDLKTNQQDAIRLFEKVIETVQCTSLNKDKDLQHYQYGSEWILGCLYKDLNDYTNSEKYYKLALDNIGQLFRQNPDEYYRDDLAITQNNLGDLYSNLHDYANSEKYYKLALENRELLFNQNPDEYREDLAGTLNLLAQIYACLKQFDKAIETIDKAITLMPTSPNFYDTKGEILLMQGKNDEALAMWKKVMELNPNFLDNYPDGTELSNGLKKLGLIE